MTETRIMKHFEIFGFIINYAMVLLRHSTLIILPSELLAKQTILNFGDFSR